MFKIVVAIGLLLAVSWSMAIPSNRAMAAATISVSPSEGPMGTLLTLSGEGFEPGETIFLEISPVGAPSAFGIGNVTAQSNGEFSVSAELGIVYPGPDVPEPAPPGGGQKVNLAPGDYQIMAYPESLGGRTPDTIAQAPKVPFKVTVSSLPDTGGEPATLDGGFPLEVTAGLFLIVAGSSVVVGAVSLKRK